jgi:uncharacterized protein
LTPYLLDVNVLVALVRTRHLHHESVKRWFASTGGKRWATCPLTQSGFVRIVSNPKFTAQSVVVAEAVEMLAELTSVSGHEFWPLDFGFASAANSYANRFFGHQQVTDIYLLALAVRNKGRLATLDRGLESLAGEEFRKSVTVL